MCVLQLEAIEGLTIYGPRPERGRTALCSFNVEGVHPTDISTLLDMNGKLNSLCLTLGASPLAQGSERINLLRQTAECRAKFCSLICAHRPQISCRRQSHLVCGNTTKGCQNAER